MSESSATSDKKVSARQSTAPRNGQLRLKAIDILRQRILSGELPPEKQLREITVSKELGMSRTPVREAFQALATEGLVNLLPNRGVAVSALDMSGIADVFMVLGALEAFAGRLACRRITGDEIEFLGELQEDLAKYFEKRERLAYLEVNRVIHEHIVQASKSPALIAAWKLLLPRAERARRISTLASDRWAEAFQEHCDIFQAISNRDEERMCKLMEMHFQNGAELFKKSKAREHAKAREKRYAEAARLGREGRLYTGPD